MAELLWDCGYEEQNRRPQFMAISQNSHVYMEAVEETKDKGKKSDKDGCTRGFGMAGWKQSSWVLVYDTHGCY